MYFEANEAISHARQEIVNYAVKSDNIYFKINYGVLLMDMIRKTVDKKLCITEKLHILKADKSYLLNKRSELISKCRHENKFHLINFHSDNYPP